MRKVVCAAIVKGGAILLVRKAGTDKWILPSGKPREGESDRQCLMRELGEELPGLRARWTGIYCGSFIGKAPRKGYEVEAIVYLVQANGDILPAAEIEAASWDKYPENSNVSEATWKAAMTLRKNGIY